MAITKRQVAIFASGLLLVAVAVAGAWVIIDPDLSLLLVKSKTSVAPPQPPVPASEQLAACPLQPAAAAAGEKDGQLPLEVGVSGLIAADIGTFIVVGSESVAAGRPRDAEVAFLMACRVADKLKGSNSVESADARYQLGAHYAALAIPGRSDAASHRAELLKRAELLYADSLQVYRLKYGPVHKKSSSASDGLATVRQTLAQAQTLQLEPDPAIVPDKPTPSSAPGAAEPVISAAKKSDLKPYYASVSSVQPRKAVLAKTVLPGPRKPIAASRPEPGLNCARARSIPETMICSDAELAQLDRELGRLYARAKNSTSNSAAFHRKQDHEWRMRESTCRDRACLLSWYAQRRDQLMTVIEQREPS
ncbi:MAG: hypothetical protein ABIQ90_04720 [Polaromonas sp.]